MTVVRGAGAGHGRFRARSVAQRKRGVRQVNGTIESARERGERNVCVGV